MVYWIILIVLAFLASFEIYNKKKYKNVFYVFYIILTVMVALRQGQGSDYYNYYEIYKEVDYYSNISIWNLFLMRDPGYAFLNYFAILLHFSYYTFAVVFSIVSMLVYFRFFNKVCSQSLVSLFVFYAVYFLSYPYSSVRQGFAMAVLIGILYPLLQERKLLKYYLVLFLTCTIHASLIICIFLPLVTRLQFSVKSLLFIFVPFIFILFFRINILEYIPISFIRVRASYYMDDASFSQHVVAMLVRLCVLLPVFLVPNVVYRNNPELLGIRNIIFCAFIIYSLLSFSQLISSRVSVYFRVFELVFLSKILHDTCLEKINKSICGYMMIIAVVLFTKNIGSFIQQGSYENCNIFTYPYLNLFDDNKTIMYYRKSLSFADEMPE